MPIEHLHVYMLCDIFIIIHYIVSYTVDQMGAIRFKL